MSKQKPVMSHDPLAALDEPLAEVGQGVSVPEQPVVSLPATLTIADVAEVHAALMESLDRGSEWSLDASEVEMIDGAGMQLLVALAKAAEQRQAKLVWTGVSDTVTVAAGQLGLVESLGLVGTRDNAGA